VSALKGLLGTREKNLCQISTKLNDLVVEAEPKVLEVACQTVKDILSAQKASLAEKPNPSSSGDSPATIPFDNSDFTLLKEKVWNYLCFMRFSDVDVTVVKSSFCQ